MSDIQSQPTLDLEQAVKLFSGDRSVALKMLKMFVDNLPEARRLFDDASLDNDWGRVAYHMHTLKGAAAYCGLPRLIALCQSNPYHQHNEDDILVLKDQLAAVRAELDAIEVEAKALLASE